MNSLALFLAAGSVSSGSYFGMNHLALLYDVLHNMRSCKTLDVRKQCTFVSRCRQYSTTNFLEKFVVVVFARVFFFPSCFAIFIRKLFSFSLENMVALSVVPSLGSMRSLENMNYCWNTDCISIYNSVPYLNCAVGLNVTFLVFDFLYRHRHISFCVCVFVLFSPLCSLLFMRNTTHNELFNF